MQPEGTLLQTPDGMLFGTCTLGGTAGAGGVFRMTADGGEFTLLHHFGAVVDDARQPSAGLSPAGEDWQIGTTFAGGMANLGGVYRVSRDGNRYELVHHFSGGFSDGVRSRSRLTPGVPGTFYSATLNGGASNFGTVMKLTLE